MIPDDKQRILITGVTGYVGRQLARELTSAGFIVFGTSRSPDTLGPTQIFNGDLTDRSFADSLAKRIGIDFDLIVHAAAVTRVSGKRSLEDVNRSICQNLIAACEQKENARIIFLSSDLAHGQIGQYGKSKHDSEQMFRESKVDYAIIRMGPFLGDYDPKANSTLSKIIKTTIEKPLLILPAGGRLKIAPTFLNDLVLAISRISERNELGRKIYDLRSEPCNLIDFIRDVERTVGIQPPRPHINIPLWAIRFGARCLKTLPFSSRLPIESLMNIGHLEPIETSTIRDDLKFQPRKVASTLTHVRNLPRVES